MDAESMSLLAPHARAVPEAYGARQEYMERCAAAGLALDEAVLGEVAEALAAGNPELAALQARIARIVEAAEATGALDEAAFAELPEAAADHLRMAWAVHRAEGGSDGGGAA